MNLSPEEMYEKRKQFFNDHAEKWLDMWYRDEATGRYDAHAAGFARLFAALPLSQGQSVCDIGCGPGVLVPYILERIGPSGLLYEIDVAEKMIEVNRKLHPEPNIRFMADDIANRPVPEASCDAAICFSCFPHFQDKPGALSAVQASNSGPDPRWLQARAEQRKTMEAVRKGAQAKWAGIAKQTADGIGALIDEAAKAGVTAVIQPGGSIRDAEVIQAADEHGMAMVFTGVRIFRH